MIGAISATGSRPNKRQETASTFGFVFVVVFVVAAIAHPWL